MSALKASLGMGAMPNRWANDESMLRRAFLRWRALVAAALLALALGTALFGTGRGQRSLPASASPAVQMDGSAVEPSGRLPQSLRGPVSRTLGAAGEAYRVGTIGGALTARNPAQHLSVLFGRSGISVRAGATRVGLSVRALGFGSSRSPLGPADPRASANRVVYQHENVAEWYANGPLGLEQGFTIRRRPAGAAAGSLTLALALSGNAHASLASGGHGIALSRTGGASLRYTGLSASDSKGRPLRSWLELRGAELLLRVDARGARYPLRIDPFVQQKEKLTGSGELGEGLFGVSVALSSDGNTALIGGPNDAQKLETEGEVTEKSKIVKGLLSTTGVFAGSQVSGTQILAGTTVVRVINTKEVELSDEVQGEGTSKVKEKLTFTTPGVGAAWVFTRSGPSWTQQAKLANPLNAKGEKEEVGMGRFGESVALSADGSTALIGAPEDGATVLIEPATIGAAWVYTRSGSTWTKQGAKLKGGSESGNGLFGKSVALGGGSAGNTALIGGPFDSKEVGAAWIFTRSAGVWTQQAELKEPKNAKNENEEVGASQFGYSVALGGPEGTGTTALIGGPEDNGAVGAAWVYTRSETTWTKQGAKLTGGGEVGQGLFGRSVALASTEANTALIGGPNNQRLVLTTQGEVTEKSRIVKGLPSNSGIVAGDEVSGAKIVVGTTVKRVISPTEVELLEVVQGTGSATVTEMLTFTETEVGAAWVFTRSSEKWTQQAQLTASGEIGKGFFGEDPSLTADGGTALIGAPHNNGEAGAAWLFTRSGSSWTQVEQLVPSDEEGKGQFGQSAALSSAGTTALAGGFGDNFNVGAAWVFTTGPAPTVVTGAASPVSQATATLNATVNPNGAEVSDCRFEYGTTTSYGSSAPCATSPGSGNSPVAVSALVTGLEVDTTYHFRISATDSGTSQGADHTFATLPNPPTVLTEGISNLTTNSVTLHGSVNPNATGNPAPLIECKLEWGTTTSYGSSAPCSPVPGAEETKPVRVTGQATGLLPNGTYHFRIFAKNAGGESAGSDFAFTTLGVPPTATTEPASLVTQTSASVNATVNPNGGAVSDCHFEYGPTEAYGQSAPCSSSPGSGRSPVAVSGALESLAEGATYHFRVSATNAFGTSTGLDRTFTTTLLLGPHWYANGVRLDEGASESGLDIISWGALTLENSSVGALTCQTLGGGDLANPVGGGAGKGVLDAFATYDCAAPSCEAVKGLLEVVPEKLKWSAVLIEEVGVFRDRIEGIALRALCVGGTSNVQFHGSLKPSLEAGSSIGSAPARLIFDTGSGSLQSSEGAAAVSARLKLMGFEGGEILRARKT